MDPQILQNLLLGIIAIEGGIITYSLLAASASSGGGGGTTTGGDGPGPKRPTKAFRVVAAESNDSDPNSGK